jgi:hypothetical protein
MNGTWHLFTGSARKLAAVSKVHALELGCFSTRNNVQSIYVDIQLFQLRLSTEQSGKVEYERESLLGIANK